MKILLTNDDGIDTPGIWQLASRLSTFSEVIVIAPESNQSGVGTSISLQNPITVSDYNSKVESLRSFSVSGTPADCIIFGTEYFSENSFDLIISGPNKGANAGLDIINSGTFGAAIQGFSRGIDSIAVSIGNLDPENFQYQMASEITVATVESLIEMKLEEKILFNINLPDCQSHELNGLILTTLGPKSFLETIEKLADPTGNSYAVKHENQINPDADKETDVWALKNRLISITPVNLLISNHYNQQKLEHLVKTISQKSDCSNKQNCSWK